MFYINIETFDRNSCLKKKALVKSIQIKVKFNLCDNWRIQNLSQKKRFAFLQHHTAAFIEQRYTYIFISTDHSLLLFYFTLT